MRRNPRSYITMTALPPLLSDAEITALGNQRSPILLPATYHDAVYEVHRVNDSIADFLKHDLIASRLDEVYTWLWIAGRQTSARPLHCHRLYRRNIVVTEQIDLHLVWFEDTIYIKPLPGYLLDYSFWSQHLCGTDLYASALGLLLSYSWLVCHASDFHVAKDCHLIPEAIQFKDWIRLMDIATVKIDPAKIHRRYHYGELKLARLDLIYRWTFRQFIGGYHVLHHQYSSLFRRHFGWITVTSFAYYALVLTAMQVALATSGFKNNATFNDISQWCAVFAIAFPPLVAVVVVSLFVIYVLYNAVAIAMQHQGKHRKAKRESAEHISNS